MNDPLRAYLDQSRNGLADMPAGIVVSLTMRRCTRVKKNEGRLLEDLGIQPDVLDQMTFKDITEQNQDLYTRASLELTKMPAYDLAVDSVLNSGAYTLKCRTLNLNSLEVFNGQQYVTGASVSDGKITELSVPAEISKIEVRGFAKDSLAVRKLLALSD